MADPRPIPVLATLFVALSFGCASMRTVQVDATRQIVAQKQIPPDELLDVGIATFDPGLPAPGEEIPEDLFPEIRKAESRFMPVQLKETLQHTGQWGVVRVLPDTRRPVDVTISGRVLESTGAEITLEISVHDATGSEWFTRRYAREAEPFTYAPRDAGPKEPFQDLYNRIANDMVAARARLSASDLRNLRRVAAIRFASSLAPQAFANYVREDEDGIYVLRRLPAEGDPMMARVELVRERDDMLVDALNEHYSDFHLGMQEPYTQWRALSYEEIVIMRDVRRESLIRSGAGIAALAGGLALTFATGGAAAQILAPILMAGGAFGIGSGWAMMSEPSIHAEAIRELGSSFEAEVSPRVVEIEGQSVRLTGSAEAQYETWRRTLEKIYEQETGFDSAAPPGPSGGRSSASPGAR